MSNKKSREPKKQKQIPHYKYCFCEVSFRDNFRNKTENDRTQVYVFKINENHIFGRDLLSFLDGIHKNIKMSIEADECTQDEDAS